jgi:uncharacterized protein YbjT (DUF2867 family)
MNVLVVGGTGVVAEGVVLALLKSGHQVTLLSRHAEEEKVAWPGSVRFRNADVTDPASLRGSAGGMDAVVHLAGIIREQPPELTFEKVNVIGVRNIVQEANVAGVHRFIHVSSLGAERGVSPYHASKRRGEAEVQACHCDWVILRPGGVYGPGDETISTVLKMVRTWPVVPVVGQGDQVFQPIWFEDLGAAICRCITDSGLGGKSLNLAGTEQVTVNDLINRLRKLTCRNAPTIGFPTRVTRLAVRSAEWLSTKLRGMIKGFHAEPPLSDSTLTMLLEGNLIEADSRNSLPELLRRPPTCLDEGLRRLVDEMPELEPDEGVGRLTHKRFWSDFPQEAVGSAETLMELCQQNIAEIMPIDFCAEPGASQSVAPGCTFTAQLPIRGHIQIRIEECSPRSVIFMTVQGHPLAGMVHFSVEDRDRETRFQIEVHCRAGSVLDWVAEKTFAWYLQNQTWRGVLRRLAKAAGVERTKIHSRSRTVSHREAVKIDSEARRVVQRRKRRERLALLSEPGEIPHVERAQRP